MFGIQDVVPEDSMKEEIMDSIQKGNFTMRILKDQLQNILKMGPMGQVMGMIPGFANNMMPQVTPATATTMLVQIEMSLVTMLDAAHHIRNENSHNASQLLALNPCNIIAHCCMWVVC